MGHGSYATRCLAKSSIFTPLSKRIYYIPKGSLLNTDDDVCIEIGHFESDWLQRQRGNYYGLKVSCRVGFEEVATSSR